MPARKLKELPRDDAKVEALTRSRGPVRFRRLQWNELVTFGDFVGNGKRGFEPWEGPTGFRADSFVKPIYRRQRRRTTRAAK